MPPAGLAIQVFETQEVKCLGLAVSPAFASRGREAAELDQSGFLGMELQAEAAKPLLQLGQEPLGI